MPTIAAQFLAATWSSAYEQDDATGHVRVSCCCRRPTGPLPSRPGGRGGSGPGWWGGRGNRPQEPGGVAGGGLPARIAGASVASG